MLPASDLRSGVAVRVEGVLHRVIGADYHGGAGKTGGVTFMVPPFIAPGEVVRVEIKTGKYVELAKTDKKKP